MNQPAQAAQQQQPVADKRVLRALVARRYLGGSGIEVGALGTPLDLPPNAQAKYVDRMSLDDLYASFPEMAQRKLQAPDIVDNGETLEKVPDGSLDFIVANHFLEHCQNLLGTLRVHTAKLRKGGRLFYAMPNRQFTFDKHRPNTRFEHLVQDDQEGPEKSRAQHFLDWATLVNGKQGEEARLHAEKLMAEDYSIHYHAWDAQAWFATLAQAVEYNKFPGFVAHFELNLHEILCVLVRAK